MKKKILFVMFFSFAILATGCNKTTAPEVCSLTGSACLSGSAIDQTLVSGVLLAIKNNDLPALANFVGPQGLRFSPYEYINTGTDVVLSQEEVRNGLTTSRSFTWGAYDGSGEPMDLGIGQYFEAFVQDANWETAPEITYNEAVQRGNTTNNIAEVYSGKQWVNFYFSGFEAQYEGIDWKILSLVFEETNGQRYLIGITHGAWTI